MKALIGAVLLAVAGVAYANCTTNLITYPNGKMVSCTTCCYNGNCTTNCF